jgi:hypothetical protein
MVALSGITRPIKGERMHNDDVERFEVDGLTVRILQDSEPFNPRTDHDNFGHMVCFHRRYDLGDKHSMSVEEAKEFVERIEKEGGVALPLYLYDHSGITMRTSPFSCPWDSGQVGFIYAEKKDIRENWMCKNVTKKRRQEAIDLLVAEVSEYDSYLTGEVYGYIIESPEDSHLDSCWGFIGDIKYCREEATAAAKSEAAHIAKLTAQGETAAQKYGAEHNA